MVIIDANYVLRWFLNDNAAQADEVDKLLVGSKQATIMLDRVTMAEITYVLRAQKYDHSQVFQLLEELCYYPSLAPLSDIDRATLEIYRDTTLDFEDCVLLAFNKIRAYKTGTFDKAILKLAS